MMAVSFVPDGHDSVTQSRTPFSKATFWHRQTALGVLLVTGGQPREEAFKSMPLIQAWPHSGREVRFWAATRPTRVVTAKKDFMLLEGCDCSNDRTFSVLWKLDT